jgi:hypothetical protein
MGSKAMTRLNVVNRNKSMPDEAGEAAFFLPLTQELDFMENRLPLGGYNPTCQYFIGGCPDFAI